MKLTWLAGFVSAIFVLLLSGTISADVYVYKDKEGVLTFTSVPCTEEQGCARVVPARQWQWRDDINGDGKVTIGDVPGWVKWLFYYPGDWVIYELLKRRGKAAEFLELTPASYGGQMSGVISGVLIPLGFFAAPVCLFLLAYLAFIAVPETLGKFFSGCASKIKYWYEHH
jgi:hypothetical protein